jgi:hypothetical protein
MSPYFQMTGGRLACVPPHPASRSAATSRLDVRPFKRYGLVVDNVNVNVLL